MRISAVVLTKDEKENIERCLESLSWCDEIVIIDDYSEDKTLSAESYSRNLRRLIPGISRLPLKIFKRHLNNDFAAQRNFGLEKARGTWVLFVDADEVISETLISEIKSEIRNPRPTSHGRSPGGRAKSEICGYYFKRKDYFLGKWLKYGETGSVRLLRLARKNAGRWQGRVHEVWKVEGAAGELENPILHYPHESISQFLRKINHYTDLVAQYWKEEGRVVHVWEIIVYPVGKCIQNYILRLGFLDGMPGLILAITMSFHSFLGRSKYWLATQK